MLTVRRLHSGRPPSTCPKPAGTRELMREVWVTPPDMPPSGPRRRAPDATRCQTPETLNPTWRAAELKDWRVDENDGLLEEI
jgi:hypothetical protein